MTGREYRHEKVKDPITGHHYWQTCKVELPPLDDERCMSLVAEEVRKEYCLSSVNSIYTWIGKYVSQSGSLSLRAVWLQQTVLLQT